MPLYRTKRSNRQPRPAGAGPRRVIPQVAERWPYDGDKSPANWSLPDGRRHSGRAPRGRRINQLRAVPLKCWLVGPPRRGAASKQRGIDIVATNGDRMAAVEVAVEVESYRGVELRLRSTRRRNEADLSGHTGETLLRPGDSDYVTYRKRASDWEAVIAFPEAGTFAVLIGCTSHNLTSIGSASRPCTPAGRSPRDL